MNYDGYNVEIPSSSQSVYEEELWARQNGGGDHGGGSYSPPSTFYSGPDDTYSPYQGQGGHHRPCLNQGEERDRKWASSHSTLGGKASRCYRLNDGDDDVIHSGRRYSYNYGYVPPRYQPIHGLCLVVLLPIVLLASIPELFPVAILLTGACALASISCCALKHLRNNRRDNSYEY